VLQQNMAAYLTYTVTANSSCRLISSVTYLEIGYSWLPWIGTGCINFGIAIGGAHYEDRGASAVELGRRGDGYGTLKKAAWKLSKA
jgi:hypothetical protein